MKNPISLFGAKPLICLATALMLAACGGGGDSDNSDGGSNGGGGDNGGGSGDGRPHTLTLKLQGLPDGATLPLTFGNVTQSLTTNTSIPITGVNPTVSLGKLTLKADQPYLVQCLFAEPLAGSIKNDGSLQTGMSADETQVVQCNQRIAPILNQRNVSAAGATSAMISGLNVLTANLDGTQAQWLDPKLMVKQSTERDKLAAFMGNELYVSAKDDNINSATGWELRATDGSAAGTRLVKDIATGDIAGVGNSSTPTKLTVFGNKIYFSTSGGTDSGLWVSDGSDAGTQPVKFNGSAINAGGTVVAGGNLFFTVNGTGQLMSIDSSGTVTELGITSWGTPVAVGDRIYITDENESPFLSDGTVAGTKIFNAPTPWSNPVQLGDWLYFYAADPSDESQVHLWKSKSDGSEAQLVKAFNASGPSSVGQAFMVNLNGTLIFDAYDGVTTGIYASDGTAAGTKLIHTGNFSSIHAIVNNHLIFLDSEDRDIGDGTYLWTTDGTAAGTQRLAAEGIASFMQKTADAGFQKAGPDRVVFLIHRGDSTSIYADAWVTDGTTAGTRKLQDKNGSAITVLE